MRVGTVSDGDIIDGIVGDFGIIGDFSHCKTLPDFQKQHIGLLAVNSEWYTDWWVDSDFNTNV